MLSKLPVKNERSEYFEAKSDTQKLDFLKVFTERSFN